MAQRNSSYRAKNTGIDSAWRTVNPGPIVMLYGPEEYFASRARTRLRQLFGEHFGDYDYVQLNAASYTRGELLMNASPSLFGSAKIISVDNAGSMSDDFLEDMLAYAAAPESDIMVIIQHSGGNRGKKLIDLVRSRFTLISCKALKNDREKTEFIVQEFHAADRRITQGAVQLLAVATADTAELASACAQLMADIPGEITEEGVNRYYGGRTEVNAFRVADAAIAGQAAQALRLLRHSLATGTEPIPLLGALAMRIRNIARVYGVRGSGAELASSTGMAPWQVDQAKREGRRFSAEQLAAIISNLADADVQLKGEGADPVYALERAVLTIAVPGRD